MISPISDRCLYTYEDIILAINNLANQINAKTKTKEMVFAPVMTGSLVFAGHLLPLLSHKALHINYLHYSRYVDNNGIEDGHWIHKPRRDEVLNKHVLLIDDILDEGKTLHECVSTLKRLGAKTVTSCVLFYKPNTKAKIDANFKGLELPNLYVYGFGLDSNSIDRNHQNLYAKNS
jgi:hypoxanthine phosphoribosyltransferase